jgi:septum formation protein
MREKAPKIILASASPRRAELLRNLGLRFEVRPVAVSEVPSEGEKPADFALRMASEKALKGRRSDDELAVGCDTVVVVGEEILGKPEDAAQARSMLGLLGGRVHTVITAVAVAGERLVSSFAETAVEFEPLDERTIEWYIATGEPMDKAGAYGIQGKAAVFVRRIDGPYDNVVGLPVNLLGRLLAEFGFTLIEFV